MAARHTTRTDSILAELKAQQEAERKKVAKLAARWEAAAVAIEEAETALAAAKADYGSAVAEWADATSAASVARLSGLPARTVSEHVNSYKRRGTNPASSAENA